MGLLGSEGSESNIQEELDGAVRNKVVFITIAKKMLDQGFTRDWEQCRNKIKKYRMIKDHNGETERGRKQCKFYKELDAILGHRPASVPAVLLDTGNNSNPLSDSEAENTEERETNGNKMLMDKLINTM